MHGEPGEGLYVFGLCIGRSFVLFGAEHPCAEAFAPGSSCGSRSFGVCHCATMPVDNFFEKIFKKCKISLQILFKVVYNKSHFYSAAKGAVSGETGR